MNATHKPGGGRLKWSAVIQSPPTAKLPSGQPDQSQWVANDTRRVEVVPMPGDKAQDGSSQQQQTAWFQVTMRLKSDLLPSYRMTLSGAPYNGLTVYVDSLSHTETHTIAHCVVKGNQ